MTGGRGPPAHEGCYKDVLGSGGEGVAGHGGGRLGAEVAGQATLARCRDLPADHRLPGRGGDGVGAQVTSRGEVHGPRAEGEARH